MAFVSNGRINMVSATNGNNSISAYFAPAKGTPHWLSQFYRGGTYVASGVSTNVPTSGKIWFSNFYGVNKTVASNVPVRYPPAALTTGVLSTTTTLSGKAYGNGTYSISASGQYGAGESTGHAFDMLDNTTWTVGGYNSTTGVYNGANTTTVDSVSQSGEWIQIVLPEAIIPTYFYLMESGTRNATSMVIAGSINGTSWTSLYASASLPTIATNRSININVNTQTAYNYYRYIARAINPANQYSYHSLLEFAVYGYVPTPTNVPVRYPPVSLGSGAMNPNPVVLSGASYGNGSYITSASSVYGDTVHHAGGPFDFDTTSWPAGAWANSAAAGYTYNGSTGAYGGSTSTTVGGTAHLGEWFQIRLPEAIVLTSYKLIEVAERMATSFIVAGSIDGTNWSAVSTQTPAQTAGTGLNTTSVTISNNTTAYSYYRTILKTISSRNQYGFAGVWEMELYGYPPSLVSGGLAFNIKVAPSSGTSWPDVSGNGYNATVNGTFTYTNEYGGGIITTVAGASYISVPYNLSTNTFTVSMVAKLNPSAYWATWWGNENYNSRQGYWCWLGNSTTIYPGSPSEADTNYPSNYTIAANSYTSVAQWDFVFSGTSVKIYKNGVVLVSNGTFTAPTGGYATTNFYFGARHGNAGTSYADLCPGTYYQMRVYTRALSATEIVQNYNAVCGTYGLSPILTGSASGGTVSTSGTDTIHTFTTSGSFVVSSALTAQVLIVAGGGGGGSPGDRSGGGGGAGGLVYYASQSFAPGTYTVTVGGGGAGGATGGNNGTNGTSSSITGLTTAVGGGGGVGGGTAGSTGGSGGGVKHGASGAAGAGTSGQGYAGSSTGYDAGGGGTRTYAGGGGGGAGAIGGSASSTSSGAGGTGVAYSISGSSVYYAGGGGGGCQQESTSGSTSGGGGNGGGGRGAFSAWSVGSVITAVAGTANTGGGGGGGAIGGNSGGTTNTLPGASGGSGIVIIRYR